MAIKHPFHSAVADGTDSSLVRPSNWNADHTIEAGSIAHSDLTGLTSGDDHTQYQKESEKGAANGYASLDSGILVPIAQLPTGTGASQVALGNHTHGGGGGGATTVKKTADETVSASTTLQDDDHLFFAVVANAVYYFDLELLWSIAGGGSKVGWSVPASATMAWYLGSDYTFNTNLTAGSTDAHNNSGTIHMHYQGFITIVGTSGTAQFRWAQNSATSTSTLLKGSILRYERTDT